MMLSAAYRNVRLFFVLGGLLCGIAAGQAKPDAPAPAPGAAAPAPGAAAPAPGPAAPAPGAAAPAPGPAAPAPGAAGAAPAVPKVVVDSISPATVYRNDDDNSFDFEISGDNLAPEATDNMIERVGHGLLVIDKDCKGDPATQNTYIEDHEDDFKKNKKVCVSYLPGMVSHKLTVKGYHRDDYEGPASFRVHTANSISDPKRVVFSLVSEMRLRVLAIGVSLAIAAIVLLMVWKGIGLYKIAGESYSPLSSFFLDKETNSYSLSKFQLLAWTTVAVFGYIYLLFCQSLIQWSFKFPDVPSGWPTLLGVSAATTVTAVGITTTRGSKGSGPVLPSLADFITSGGVVLSSRFQFFVWTLVGCAGFLFLTLKNDPSSLNALPDVPSGFLYLMGISAAGYLGGKLVNLPGPVVQQLVVSSVVPAAGTAAAQLVINLKGQNLSTNAAVKVDDKDLRMMEEFVIECVTPQSQPPDPSFCTEVKVTLKAADSYLDGVHTLTITNKDAQMAASKFPLDALTITPVATLDAGTTSVPVVVNGTNFVEGMTAVWKNASQQETVMAAGQVQKKTDTQVTVTLVPGAAGKGTLTLVSPIGLRSHVDVNVK